MESAQIVVQRLLLPCVPVRSIRQKDNGLADLLCRVDPKQPKLLVSAALHQAPRLEIGRNLSSARQPKGSLVLEESDRFVVHGLMEQIEPYRRNGLQQVYFYVEQLISIAVNPSGTFEEDSETVTADT